MCVCVCVCVCPYIIVYTQTVCVWHTCCERKGGRMLRPLLQRPWKVPQDLEGEETVHQNIRPTDRQHKNITKAGVAGSLPRRVQTKHRVYRCGSQPTPKAQTHRRKKPYLCFTCGRPGCARRPGDRGGPLTGASGGLPPPRKPSPPPAASGRPLSG